MKVLYIGGTGEISYSCLHASVALGQQVSIFNRGRNDEPLPGNVQRIVGDMADETAYRALGQRNFDVICQFKAYDVPQIKRDLEVFGGRCGQYLFISSASAYLKPPSDYVITEATPLANPYWPYSQGKLHAEALLMESHAAKRLPVTIVRPSHTYRRLFPGTYVDGDTQAWRMLQGKAIVVHGDGTALWTYTHADDFAVPFARLLGNAKALGEAFHITADHAYPWSRIMSAMAQALGVNPKFVFVPTQTLVRYNPEWTGKLLGDKTWSTLFDNTKVKSVAGEFFCRIWPEAGLKRVAGHYLKRWTTFKPDEKVNALIDRIAAEQEGLGGAAGG